MRNAKIFFIIIAVGIFVFSAIELKPLLATSFAPSAPLPQQTISLKGADDTAVQILQACSDEHRSKLLGKSFCYREKFEEVAFQRGDKFAFKTLHEVQKQDQRALSCHLIAHAIGKGTFKRDPSDWKNQINTILPTCIYGALHGIMETYASSIGEGKFTKEILQTMCDPDSGGGCFHALGHIVLVTTGDDLPKAIDLCSTIEGEALQAPCFGGVFMESITALNLIEHGYRTEVPKKSQERLDDFSTLCRSYAGQAAVQCWQEIVHAAPRESFEQPEIFFDFCDTAQTKEAANRCKLHTINFVIVQSQFNLQGAKYLCALDNSDTNFEKNCYTYIARSTLLRVPEHIPDVATFCTSLDEQFQADCLGGIQTVLKSRSPSELEELQELCQTVSEEEVQDYCIESTTLQKQ